MERAKEKMVQAVRLPYYTAINQKLPCRNKAPNNPHNHQFKTLK